MTLTLDLNNSIHQVWHETRQYDLLEEPLKISPKLMIKPTVLMTLMTISAIKSCRGIGRRGLFLTASSNRHDHDEHVMCTKNNAVHHSKIPTTFQFHHTRHCSSPALATMAATLRYPTSAILCLSSLPSNLITKPNPGNISPEKEYILCFHGKSPTSKTNGVAGSGMVLYEDNAAASEELWWGRQCLGNVTINEAEYITLVTALECAKSLGVQHIKAHGHNQLILKQMEGINRVNSPTLKEYYNKAIELSKEFASFQISHINKKSNRRAAGLAKEAMVDTNMQDATTNILERDSDNEPSDGMSKNKQLKSLENFAPATTPPSFDADDVSSVPSGSISPDKTYVLRFDGGSRGNPGTSGVGMVLYDTDDGAEIWSGYQYLGETNTNNEAEYMGLITGLQCAKSLGIQHIVVQGDSQLILRQVEGKYKVNSPNLKEYYNEAVQLSKEFASFHTSHIERARNSRADELANLAMDLKASNGFDIEE